LLRNFSFLKVTVVDSLHCNYIGLCPLPVAYSVLTVSRVACTLLSLCDCLLLYWQV
jgi:hypothetical protein